MCTVAQSYKKKKFITLLSPLSLKYSFPFLSLSLASLLSSFFLKIFFFSLARRPPSSLSSPASSLTTTSVARSSHPPLSVSGHRRSPSRQIPLGFESRLRAWRRGMRRLRSFLGFCRTRPSTSRQRFGQAWDRRRGAQWRGLGSSQKFFFFSLLWLSLFVCLFVFFF